MKRTFHFSARYLENYMDGMLTMIIDPGAPDFYPSLKSTIVNYFGLNIEPSKLTVLSLTLLKEHHSLFHHDTTQRKRRHDRD